MSGKPMMVIKDNVLYKVVKGRYVRVKASKKSRESMEETRKKYGDVMKALAKC